MTLKVDDNVNWGATGSSRSPFLTYLFGEFGKMKPGASFLVSQTKLEHLAAATARGIVTPKGLATRVCWAYQRWSKQNGNAYQAKYRREGETNYRVFIVRRPPQPNVNANQGDLPNV